jgi:TatD DNase family protein
MAEKRCLKAIGRCGLDFSLLKTSSYEQQHKILPYHFDIAKKFGFPIYLEDRDTEGELIEIVNKRREHFSEGLIHSFYGSEKELNKILDLDMYVGINRKSIKFQENRDIIKMIPLKKLILEAETV